MTRGCYYGTSLQYNLAIMIRQNSIQFLSLQLNIIASLFEKLFPNKKTHLTSPHP